jgi:hypothetical protein
MRNFCHMQLWESAGSPGLEGYREDAGTLS